MVWHAQLLAVNEAARPDWAPPVKPTHGSPSRLGAPVCVVSCRPYTWQWGRTAAAAAAAAATATTPPKRMILIRPATWPHALPHSDKASSRLCSSRLGKWCGWAGGRSVKSTLTVCIALVLGAAKVGKGSAQAPRGREPRKSAGGAAAGLMPAQALGRIIGLRRRRRRLRAAGGQSFQPSRSLASTRHAGIEFRAWKPARRLGHRNPLLCPPVAYACPDVTLALRRALGGARPDANTWHTGQRVGSSKPARSCPLQPPSSLRAVSEGATGQEGNMLLLNKQRFRQGKWKIRGCWRSATVVQRQPKEDSPPRGGDDSMAGGARGGRKTSHVACAGTLRKSGLALVHFLAGEGRGRA